MTFYPDDAPVPAELRTEEFLLRPLRAGDVDLDYEAVMATQETLRRSSGGRWPRPDFTLEENLADLEGHEADFRARRGFTYTVMDPTETHCLGCVYAYPPEDEDGVVEPATTRPWSGSGSARTASPPTSIGDCWQRWFRGCATTSPSRVCSSAPGPTTSAGWLSCARRGCGWSTRSRFETLRPSCSREGVGTVQRCCLLVSTTSWRGMPLRFPEPGSYFSRDHHCG